MQPISDICGFDEPAPTDLTRSQLLDIFRVQYYKLIDELSLYSVGTTHTMVVPMMPHPNDTVADLHLIVNLPLVDRSCYRIHHVVYASSMDATASIELAIMTFSLQFQHQFHPWCTNGDTLHATAVTYERALFAQVRDAGMMDPKWLTTVNAPITYGELGVAAVELSSTDAQLLCRLWMLTSKADTAHTIILPSWRTIVIFDVVSGRACAMIHADVDNTITQILASDQWITTGPSANYNPPIWPAYDDAAHSSSSSRMRLVAAFGMMWTMSLVDSCAARMVECRMDLAWDVFRHDISDDTEMAWHLIIHIANTMNLTIPPSIRYRYGSSAVRNSPYPRYSSS